MINSSDYVVIKETKIVLSKILRIVKLKIIKKQITLTFPLTAWW